MLTREQWEDAARFMGIPCHHRYRTQFQRSTGATISIRCADCGSTDGAWVPDVLWDDFGPLWVKLKAYEGSQDSNIAGALFDFEFAETSGDARQIMQAGLILAAAIGKTMRETKP